MDNKDKYKLLVLLHNPLNDRRSGVYNQGHDSNDQPLQDIESSFCSVSNLKSCVVYLAQELQNLGFRYKIVEPNEEKLNLVALVNACWDIIQLYHAAVKDGNILHDSRRRDAADLNHLQSTIKELKSTLEEKERLLLEAQEKERQANSINKALASKLKAEKDDVKRLNSILQQRELQHQHENRKKEKEVNKLQDRLHRFVTNDRGTETRLPTITMTSSLSRSDRARGRWRTDHTSVKQEEELYRRVLGQYETWVGQLTEETDLLKEFLSTVSGRISKIALKCANSQLSSAVDEESLSDSLACSVLSDECREDDPIFSLSFISSKDKIQKMFEDNIQIISRTLEDKETCRNRSLDQDLYSSIEKNIEDVMEGICVEKESEMENQMKQVLELKKKLQLERENFAAAAVKLNRERANFEAEKVELLRHQFLSELPKSISSNSGTPFTPNTSFESPVNGSLSDLYGDSPHAIPAIPVLTSPTGNITHTTQPITLGPTRLTRSHREGKIRTSKCGVFSDPTTRTSSANRTSDVRFLHEVPLSKTLERPVRSACHTPYTNNSEEGSSYFTRSLSRPSKVSEGTCPSKVSEALSRPSKVSEGTTYSTRSLSRPSKVSEGTCPSKVSEALSRPSKVSEGTPYSTRSLSRPSKVSEALSRPNKVSEEALSRPSKVSEGTPYSTRSLSRPGKSRLLQSSANINLSHSINCPPLEVRERCGTNIPDLTPTRIAPGYRVLSPGDRVLSPGDRVLSPGDRVLSPGDRVLSPGDRVLSPGTQATDESISTDSGFYHDDTENQSFYHKIKNAQSNSRLNSLENSLMNLLDQINSKERLSLTCPAGGLPFSSKITTEGEAEVSKDESSGQCSFHRRNSLNILSNRSARNFHFDPQQSPMTSTSSIGGFSRQIDDSINTSNRVNQSTHLSDIEKFVVQQCNAPGSGSASRKSSCDRKTGEYYLKKIQNNFAKWYWK